MTTRERNWPTFFALDVADYHAGTELFTALEHGCYYLLLLAQFRSKELQAVPSSRSDLRLICRGTTPSARVLAKFDPIEVEGQPMLRNARMAKEAGIAVREWERAKERRRRWREQRRADGTGPRTGPETGPGTGLRTGQGTGDRAGAGAGAGERTTTDNGIAATTRRVAAKVVKRKPPSWSSEACDDWLKRFPGSSPPGARIGAALKPLVTAHGWPGVRPVWGFYLASTPADYLNPQTFAAKFGEFQRRMAGGAPRDTPARHFRSEQALSLLEDDDGE